LICDARAIIYRKLSLSGDHIPIVFLWSSVEKDDYSTFISCEHILKFRKHSSLISMNTIIQPLEKEQLLPLLKDFFEKEEYIELAYLFGSVSEGKAGVLSDIDVAVYLSESLTKAQRNHKRIELIGSLTTLLKSDSVDLLIINDTSPVLSFEIIRPNILIYARDHNLRVDVEHRIMSTYLDWKYYEDRLNQNLLKRIMERGLT
jgi:predicted nucleotidyltransferase